MHARRLSNGGDVGDDRRNNGCCRSVLQSFDAYPAEYCFCATSLIGLAVIVALIALVSTDVPACWVPLSRASFALPFSDNQTGSPSMQSPANECVPRVAHVVRADDTVEFGFSEWLSLRSLGTWFAPDRVVIYAAAQPQGPWFQRLLSVGPLRNRTALALAPRPLAARAAGLVRRGGVLWDTALFAVMPLSPLLCTAFDALASWDPRVGSDSIPAAALQAVVVSLPNSSLARDLAQLEKQKPQQQRCMSEACKVRLLAHRHWETTLALPGLAFFPEASVTSWRLFGSTWTYRWGTSFGVSLAAQPGQLEHSPCDLASGGNTNMRAVLRPAMWEAFFRGELPELHECPMTIDWSAVSLLGPVAAVDHS